MHILQTTIQILERLKTAIPYVSSGEYSFSQSLIFYIYIRCYEIKNQAFGSPSRPAVFALLLHRLENPCKRCLGRPWIRGRSARTLELRGEGGGSQFIHLRARDLTRRSGHFSGWAERLIFDLVASYIYIFHRLVRIEKLKVEKNR